MNVVDRASFDRGPAKRYFRGAPVLSSVLVWGGLLLIILGFIVQGWAPLWIGVIAFFGGVAWKLAIFFSADAYIRQIDELIIAEQEAMLQRGMNKLNLVGEQTGLIPPLKLVGVGFVPTDILNEGGWWARLKSWFTGNTNRPKLVERFDRVGKWRYSLIQVNIFMFDDKQVYVYTSNMDLTTGLIYNEGTRECFYTDICGVATLQNLESKINPKTRKFVDVIYEYICLTTAGHELKASIDTSASGSAVETQFAAMRNLIREKKAAA